MSLADPQSVTISGTPISLPRISEGDMKSVYRSSDGLTALTVSHNEGKRNRRMIRIDASKLAADVFKPDENVERSMSCYVVFDMPDAGYTAAEALAIWAGFATQLRASSDAVIVKLLAGES